MTVEEEVRIGVFVCHCGRNIGGYVDVPAVVEYAKGLPNVAFSEDNLYTCSADGLQAIKKAIIEHSLNRVIVASCTPRTHAPLFQSTCEKAGLNKYLFEFVNIRDQCSWVHMQEPEEATRKAKDLVRMGVAKAALLEPLTDSEMEVTPVALIIGGGIAGMTAALNLSRQGMDVHLVEKEKELGGLLTRLDTTFPNDRKAKDLLGPIMKEIEGSKRITTYLGAKVKEVNGYVGSFDVRVDDKVIRVGTIIVATGAQVARPEGLFGLGGFPNVITQLELDELLRDGKPIPQNIVMIQCAGSRWDKEGWSPYCSKVCCMSAIKNAKEILKRDPEAEVHILKRDINATGTSNEAYYHDVRGSGIKFIHYGLEDLPEVIGDKDARSVKVFFETVGKTYEIPADLVVLSTPLIAGPDNVVLSKMLKVPLHSEGFFLEAHVKLRPLEFATDGIFICGNARFPTEIRGAITEAYGAAGKAAQLMRKGTVKGEAIFAKVDPSICVGCGVCEKVCEYGAPRLEETDDGAFISKINEVVCKGCGVCSVACPSRAITMQHFKDEQIENQITAALQEVLE